MERPLDTIRSFEAAIDSGYKRRTQVPQAGTPRRRGPKCPDLIGADDFSIEASPSGDAMTGYSSRRSSVHGGEHLFCVL